MAVKKMGASLNVFYQNFWYSQVGKAMVEVEWKVAFDELCEFR